MLARWAEFETDRKAILRSLTPEKLGVTNSMCGRLCDLLEYLSFGCSSDGIATRVRQSTIADRFKVSRKTVNGWIGKAKALGLLIAVKRFGESGNQLSNEMTIDWDIVKKFCCEEKVTRGRQIGNTPCHERLQGVGKKVTPVTTSYPPEIYPSKKTGFEEKENAFGVEGWDTEKILEIDKLAEAIERGLDLKRDRNARIKAQELAIDVWNGVYERKYIDYAIGETMKVRNGKSPPPIARRVGYFSKVLGKRSEEWQSR